MADGHPTTVAGRELCRLWSRAVPVTWCLYVCPSQGFTIASKDSGIGQIPRLIYRLYMNNYVSGCLCSSRDIFKYLRHIYYRNLSGDTVTYVNGDGVVKT